MKRIRIVSAVLGAALVLAACGGSGDEQTTVPAASETTAAPTQEATTVTPTVEPTTEAPTPETSLPEVTEGATPPGTELKFGEPATIDYNNGLDDIARMQITIMEPTIGTSDEVAEGTTSYFVNMEITAVEDASHLRGANFPSSVQFFDADGGIIFSLLPTLDREGCADAQLPETFAPGDSFTRCDVAPVPDGGELGSVSFRGWDNGPYLGEGSIVWSW